MQGSRAVVGLCPTACGALLRSVHGAEDVTYYAILEQIVNKCVDYAISEEIDYQEFDELKVSLRVAMNRF